MYFNPEVVIQSKLQLNENEPCDGSENSFNIAYGIDRNFIFGCGISIASILLNNKALNFTFHIFTDFFDKKNKEEFTKLCQQYNTQIVIYIVNCDELKTLPSTKNWSYVRRSRRSRSPPATSCSAKANAGVISSPCSKASSKCSSARAAATSRASRCSACTTGSAK